jgi:hypothetical protein
MASNGPSAILFTDTTRLVITGVNIFVSGYAKTVIMATGNIAFPNINGLDLSGSTFAGINLYKSVYRDNYELILSGIYGVIDVGGLTRHTSIALIPSMPSKTTLKNKAGLRIQNPSEYTLTNEGESSLSINRQTGSLYASTSHTILRSVGVSLIIGLTLWIMLTDADMFEIIRIASRQ